jgi:hypothetical protein
MYDDSVVRKEDFVGAASRMSASATVEQVAIQVETEFARYVEMRDQVRRDFSSRRRVLLQKPQVN